MYRLYFRFLETADEYFEYPSHASRQGRWNIYGLHLPDDVLRKVYRENALRLLALKPVIADKSAEPPQSAGSAGS